MLDYKERAYSFNAGYNTTKTAKDKKKKDFNDFAT